MKFRETTASVIRVKQWAFQHVRLALQLIPRLSSPFNICLVWSTCTLYTLGGQLPPRPHGSTGNSSAMDDPWCPDILSLTNRPLRSIIKVLLKTRTILLRRKPTFGTLSLRCVRLWPVCALSVTLFFQD